jgi:hypothetical protein
LAALTDGVESGRSVDCFSCAAAGFFSCAAAGFLYSALVAAVLVATAADRAPETPACAPGGEISTASVVPLPFSTLRVICRSAPATWVEVEVETNDLPTLEPGAASFAETASSDLPAPLAATSPKFSSVALNEASSDCHPARKLSVPEKLDGVTPGVLAANQDAWCGAP